MSAAREPMVWLVVALPLATVAAGVALVAIALDAPDATGADAVRRTGQQQTADLGPDLAAARGRYAATLTLADGRVAVVLDGAAPRDLTVVLRHPGDASRDRSVALAAHDGRRWSAPVDVATAHDWNLELVPGDGAWRLVGRLHDGHAALAPRFAAGGGTPAP
jgi:hypothetical protein